MTERKRVQETCGEGMKRQQKRGRNSLLSSALKSCNSLEKKGQGKARYF